jgi:hypothetical protein
MTRRGNRYSKIGNNWRIRDISHNNATVMTKIVAMIQANELSEPFLPLNKACAPDLQVLVELPMVAAAKLALQGTLSAP